MADYTKPFFRLIWLGLLGVFFVIYLAYVSNFLKFWKVLREVTPAVVLVGIAILIASRDRMVYHRRKAAGEESEVIYLTGRDAMLHDILTFGTGAVIAVLPLTAGDVDMIDLVQAVVTIAVLWYLRYHYFHKANHGI